MNNWVIWFTIFTLITLAVYDRRMNKIEQYQLLWESHTITLAKMFQQEQYQLDVVTEYVKNH